MKTETFCQLKKGEGGQLICFPYLGGYASSFQVLVKALEDTDMEVWVANPPGHLGSDLPLVSSIDELVSLYDRDVAKIIRPDSLFFGHSMGGVVAFSLLEKMATSGARILPAALMMSASAAPCCFAGRGYDTMSREELFQKLKDYGAMPEDILNSRELMESMLPVFQADYHVLASCVTKKYQKINRTTYLLWGMEDKVEDVRNIHLWKEYFVPEIKTIPIYNAGHMYIHECADEVASHIRYSMGLLH